MGRPRGGGHAAGRRIRPRPRRAANRGADEHRAGGKPGRAARGILFRSRVVRGGAVRGRCGHREGRALAGAHLGRRALRKPRVHLVERRVGCHRTTLRVRRHRQGPARAHRARPRARPDRARDPASQTGRNLHPDLVPRRSPNGANLYFVSDHDGISNVYRMDVVSGMIQQVTDVTTGASGITALSPVISVAQRGGRLVFTAYEEGAHRLYAIDAGEKLAGGRPVDLSATRAAVLPPADAPDPTLLLKLADAETGLPPEAAFPVAPYHSKLSLSYVAPPTLAIGADRSGAYVGGGTAPFCSDLLGDHNLITGFQVNGGLN